MSNSIIQGDQYSIPILIVNQNDETVVEDAVNGVRVCIGQFVSEYPNGGLTYNNNGYWIFSLTQEKSYKLRDGKVSFQVQVKFKNGNILQSELKDVDIMESVFRGAW